jgi:hypothetical protein
MANVISLFKSIGPDIFFELIEEGLVKAIYSPSMMGTQTETINGVLQYRHVFYTVHGSKRPTSGRIRRNHIENVLTKSGILRFRMK